MIVLIGGYLQMLGIVYVTVILYIADRMPRPSDVSTTSFVKSRSHKT